VERVALGHMLPNPSQKHYHISNPNVVTHPTISLPIYGRFKGQVANMASGVGDGRLLAALERRHPKAAGVAARRQDGSRRIGFWFVPFTLFLKILSKNKPLFLNFTRMAKWNQHIITLVM